MGNYLILRSDFGLSGGAASVMCGVVYTVSDGVRAENLTYNIPPYDTWVASYRLYQTVKHWPKGTVFVSVVGPGVGNDRRSIIYLIHSGHYIIAPDSGSSNHVRHYEGIRRIIEIDEVESQLPHPEESHTFHGKDVYAYNGARLAADKMVFERLGQVTSVGSIEALEVSETTKNEDPVTGGIGILDIRFGSLWTNIPLAFLKSLEIARGNNLVVTIYHQDKKVCQNIIKFAQLLADVNVGEPLVYINLLANIGVAINQDSFPDPYRTGTGNDWMIHLSKVSLI